MTFAHQLFMKKGSKSGWLDMGEYTAFVGRLPFKWSACSCKQWLSNGLLYKLWRPVTMEEVVPIKQTTDAVLVSSIATDSLIFNYFANYWILYMTGTSFVMVSGSRMEHCRPWTSSNHLRFACIVFGSTRRSVRPTWTPAPGQQAETSRVLTTMWSLFLNVFSACRCSFRRLQCIICQSIYIARGWLVAHASTGYDLRCNRELSLWEVKYHYQSAKQCRRETIGLEFA
jgi:hypothetical protein